MNRVLKVALICGVAATMASCGAVSRNLPFGLGKKGDPKATASEGQRISVLEFEQQLAPSAALSGRTYFLPGPQAATAWTQPGGTAENLVEHVIAAPDFKIAWKRDIGRGSARVGNVMDTCTLTLPTGVPSCGISLMCPPNDEDRLLRLGAGAEKALS